MKIHCLYDEMVNPNKLKNHPKNRNRHGQDQIERLAQMYEYHGIRHPIVVSKLSGMIVAGHGRKLAAIRAGVKEMPVVYQDFESSDAEYAFIQDDNAISLWSSLDMAGINSDMGDIGPDFNIDMLGIKNFTLDFNDKEFDPSDDDEGEPESSDTSDEHHDEENKQQPPTDEELEKARDFNSKNEKHKLIAIGRGMFTKVSSEDFEYLSGFSWHSQKASGDRSHDLFHVFISMPDGDKTYRIGMHRVICARMTNDPLFMIQGSIFVDHKNLDGLDNTRENLRPCTNSENQMNKRIQKNNTTGYKGVGFDKKRDKFYCKITTEKNKRKTIGYFDTAKEAAVKYNEMALEFHGDMALLNEISEDE